MSTPANIFNKDISADHRDVAWPAVVSRAKKLYRDAFDDSVRQFSNLETAKRRAAFTRWKALENLDQYLIQFEANFIKAGGKVIWAQDSEEACNEIIGIINRSGATGIIKSKTLTAQEIHLDEALKSNSSTWTESDLGQFILQLSGEKPSHMVMPAVHKSKESVQQLFNQHLGVKEKLDAEGYFQNYFTPAGQSPFARDAWFCLEVFTKANTVGQSDGELALYVNDALAGEYKPGVPRGRWLRDNFYSWGQYFEDVQAFEGFDFRSSADVLLKRITLDAYYQKDTLDELAATTPVPEAQVILYDDVVVATERIGCRAP